MTPALKQGTAMNNPTKRQVIVVLGMPRSGTSLLANMIHVMGVNLGNNMVKANENNPEGYWENADISQLQQQILERPNLFEVPTNSLLPVPPQSARSSEFKIAKQQLVELVARELGQVPGLWGFKDARTTRLLPIWKEVFEALDLEPVYLLSLRNPLAVAASMAKLWETSPGLAQLMWITHNLDVLSGTRKHPVRMVVDYDRWFTHPREQLIALAAALGLPPSAVDSQTISTALERVKPDLRHNQGDLSMCLPWLAETYALLQAAAIDGVISPRLGAIDELVQKARVFIHYCLVGLNDPVVSEAAKQREQTIQKLDKLCSERDATIAELNRVCREREATVAELSCVCHEREVTVAELNRVCHEREATVAELNRVCHARGAAVADLNRLCSERSAAVADLDRLCKERDGTITMLDRMCRERDTTIARLECLCLEQNDSKAACTELPSPTVEALQSTAKSCQQEPEQPILENNLEAIEAGIQKPTASL
jgi:hypothetical protein